MVLFSPVLSGCDMFGCAVWPLRIFQLVEMVQDLARRLRVEPDALDCLMVNPSSDELMRLKKLAGLSAQAMQSRFGLIKVAWRVTALVIPLHMRCIMT